MHAAWARDVKWADFLEEMNRPASSGAMHWPNFYVVGAPKAGTTSLYEYLKPHPDVFLPEYKEMRMFEPEHPDSADVALYRDQYAGATGYRAIGDTTASYLGNPLVADRIREVSPDARIVIMLRDPVERAYSHYLNLQRVIDEPAASFREALRRYDDPSSQYRWLSRVYVEEGLYYESVRRYLATFGRQQVLVLLFDDLRKNPNQLLAQIGRHIGIDPGFFGQLDFSEVHNVYYVPRSRAVRWARDVTSNWGVPASLKKAVRPLLFTFKKPQMDQESRTQLQNLYDPDIVRLEDLLGQKLPELRRSWT